MNFLNVSAIIAFVAFSLLLDSCFAQKILFYGNSGIKKLDELNDISLRLSTEVDGLSISDKGVLFKLSEINPSKLSPSAVQGLVKVVTEFYKLQGLENYDVELTREAYFSMINGSDLVIEISDQNLKNLIKKNNFSPKINFVSAPLPEPYRDNLEVVNTSDSLFTGFDKNQKEVQILSEDDLSSRVKIDGNISVSTNDISQIKIQLKEEDGKFYPSPIGNKLPISKLNAHQLSPQAISQILREISGFYQEVGIPATRAVVTKESFYASREGKDLVIKIVEGKISKVRYATKSLSSRLLKRKINRIKKAAPLVDGETINSKKLDDSIGILNRFSRQNIQTVLVPENGEIILEYRVRQRDETKIKSRFDNYGSERTGEYRVFGSLDNWNLFSVDDKLSLKALTSIDGDSSYYAADYSSPLDITSSKRIAISGIYSKYNAQDVGLGASGIDFEGTSKSGQVSYEQTLASVNGAYLDAFVSARILSVDQDQTGIGVPKGNAQYFLPSLGFKFSKTGVDSSFIIGSKIETNIPSLLDTPSAVGLNNLGRLNVENNFTTANFYGAYQAYIDNTLGLSKKRAHSIEIAGSVFDSLGSRVPPSFLGVLGGHNTIRGYPVSSASGDSMVFFKLDYKVHIPRLLDIMPHQSGMRFRPRFEGDLPDWDLTFGVFTDFGMVKNNDPLFYEADDRLWSAGVGLGAKYSDLLSLNLEYGWALRELINPFKNIQPGDGELYLSLIYNW